MKYVSTPFPGKTVFSPLKKYAKQWTVKKVEYTANQKRNLLYLFFLKFWIVNEVNSVSYTYHENYKNVQKWSKMVLNISRNQSVPQLLAVIVATPAAVAITAADTAPTFHQDLLWTDEEKGFLK